MLEMFTRKARFGQQRLFTHITRALFLKPFKVEVGWMLVVFRAPLPEYARDLFGPGAFFINPIRGDFPQKRVHHVRLFRVMRSFSGLRAGGVRQGLARRARRPPGHGRRGLRASGLPVAPAPAAARLAAGRRRRGANN